MTAYLPVTEVTMVALVTALPMSVRCCDFFCTVVAMVTTITTVFRVTMVALVTEFTNLPAVSVATTVSKITKSRLYKGAGSAFLCAHFSSSCHWWVGFNFPPLAAIYILY
jgi:hypothetical protein